MRGLPQRRAVESRRASITRASAISRSSARTRRVECTSCHTAGVEADLGPRLHVVPRRGPAQGPSRRALRRVPLAAHLARAAALRSRSRRVPAARQARGARSASTVTRRSHSTMPGAKLRGLPCIAGRARRRVRRGVRHVPQPARLARDVLRPRGADGFRADGRARAVSSARPATAAGGRPPSARRRAASATARTTRTAAGSAPTARAATARFVQRDSPEVTTMRGNSVLATTAAIATLAALALLGIDRAALPAGQRVVGVRSLHDGVPARRRASVRRVRELSRRRSVRRHAAAMRRLPQPRQPSARDVQAPARHDLTTDYCDACHLPERVGARRARRPRGDARHVQRLP